MAKKCTHSLAKQETACADGLCPLCLAADIVRFNDKCVKIRRKLETELICANETCGGYEAELDKLKTEIKRLKETIKTQGERCEHLHNLLCEIHEITERYFKQILKGQ